MNARTHCCLAKLVPKKIACFKYFKDVACCNICLKEENNSTKTVIIFKKQIIFQNHTTVFSDKN